MFPQRCVLAILLAVCACVSWPGGLGAQTTCAAATSSASMGMRDYVVGLVTRTDSATVAERDSLRMPSATATQVVHVTDARLCRTAGEKVFAAFPSLGGLPPSVRVIKASSVYVVETPSPDERMPTVGAVFDLKWNLRERYLR